MWVIVKPLSRNREWIMGLSNKNRKKKKKTKRTREKTGKFRGAIRWLKLK